MKIRCHIIGARLGDKVGWWIQLDEDCELGKSGDKLMVSQAEKAEHGFYKVKE